MSYALIQISPLAVLATFFPSSPPDPIVWPDGVSTHGVPPHGIIGDEWAVVPVVTTPEAPGEFYQVTQTTPSFDGTNLVMTQTWAPDVLAGVQATLSARIDVAAETSRQKYLTPGTGQALTYQMKLAEAFAILTDAAPAATTYPLLAASVGIEADSLTAVGELVRATAAKWTGVASLIETTRLSAKRAIANATTVDGAVAGFSGVTWP